MACTSVLRHLYSFRIQAPIFGLIWADGRVKAHVDWYSLDKERLVRLYARLFHYVIVLC